MTAVSTVDPRDGRTRATHPSRPFGMKDVARLAGVSHTTVWRVLNHHAAVGATTRERVLHAARALDYRPNPAARTLATRRSNKLGIITVDSALHLPASVVYGFEQAARAAGYSVTMTCVSDLTRGAILDAVDRLRDHAVEGIATFLHSGSAGAALETLTPRLPLIAVGTATSERVTSVGFDTAAGAAMATTHLLELGHTTVHHVTGPADSIEARVRREAWRQTLRGAGAPVPECQVGDWTARSGYEAGGRLAGDPRVTAVFCASDRMALGLIRAFTEAGRRVPDDVSIAGFDDIAEAGYTSPPLTTVRQDFTALGRLAMALLAGAAADALPDGPPSVRLKPRLVVRASSTP